MISRFHSRFQATSSRRRLAFLLAGSLFVHALLLGGLPSWTWSPRNPNRSLTVLLAPVAKKEEPPAPAAEPAKPALTEPNRVEPKRPHPEAASPELRPVPQPATPEPVVSMAEHPALLTAETGTLPAEPAAAPQAEVKLAPPEPTPSPSPPQMQAAPAAPLLPPGSATLNYTVVGTEEKKNPPTLYHGNGTIVWKTLGNEYHLDLQARLSILFISLSVLSSHSEGDLGPSGLVPRRYTETPRNKSTLSVNFNRDERKSITFSATTASLPLASGVQDRLSVLMQLGAIVRGSANRQVTGGMIEIEVATPRGELDLWNFIVQGIETIDSDAGEFHTLHLKRTPRQRDGQASYEQSLDVWIAIDENVEPYPVKLRFTEPNGNHYELTLDSIE